MVLCAVTLNGSLSPVLPQLRGEGALAYAAPHGGPHLFPVHRHTVSWTSAAYYDHPQPVLPLGSKPPRHLRRPEKPHTHAGTSNPTDTFSFAFSAANGDATNGLPVQVCAYSDDDTTTSGEEVYLTANNGGAFIPSMITLNDQGCDFPVLYIPKTGLVYISAAIYYITDAFNNAGGGDEFDEYILPAKGSALINITAPTNPILIEVALGKRGPMGSLPDTFKMRRKSAKEAGGEREGKNS